MSAGDVSEYRALLEHCNTRRQREVLEAVIRTGNIVRAAKELGVTRSSAQSAVRASRKRAAKRGFAPAHDMTKTVPDGFHVKGVSTLYSGDGEVTAQWVKSNADAEEVAGKFREAFDAMLETVKPVKPIAKSKRKKPSDLMNVHIVTDYHLGMKAWREECGEDWDLKIAEQLLVNWFKYALDSAPDAQTGVLAQLGDFLHWDGLDAVTPASKHILDADSRFQKVVRVAIRSLRQIIQLMLKKYDHLHIIMADANHDPASSIWLREMFAAFYKDEPRITVDNSADTYYCVEHGSTSLFFHHGHKRKPGNIDDVLVAKFRDVFGRTKRSYCHMGHLHHLHSLETNLMVVEQHRTMAAKDAYASRGGWMADRGAPTITYSKEYGEVGRSVVTPAML